MRLLKINFSRVRLLQVYSPHWRVGVNYGAKRIEPLLGAVMTQKKNLSKLDLNAMKANQSVIILLLMAAFFLNLPLLVLLVGAFMAVGALLGVPGFYFVYRYCLKPLKIVAPHIVDGNREGPRFAQGTGAVCAIAGAALLFTGNGFAGWGFAWLVIILAGINLFTGFCAGCAFYYWMKKIKPSASPKPAA